MKSFGKECEDFFIGENKINDKNKNLNIYNDLERYKDTARGSNLSSGKENYKMTIGQYLKSKKKLYVNCGIY